jgi:hypothetical protein
VADVAEDHAQIRNLLAKYCVYLDLDDADGWVDLFTPDAVYLVYGREFVGHEGLRTIATSAPGGFHLGGPVVIDLDGDRATTTRNLLFVERGGHEARHAVYEDALVRTADGWRIQRTRCRFHTPDGLADRPPKPAA